MAKLYPRAGSAPSMGSAGNAGARKVYSPTAGVPVKTRGAHGSGTTSSPTGAKLPCSSKR